MRACPTELPAHALHLPIEACQAQGSADNAEAASHTFLLWHAGIAVGGAAALAALGALAALWRHQLRKVSPALPAELLRFTSSESLRQAHSFLTTISLSQLTCLKILHAHSSSRQSLPRHDACWQSSLVHPGHVQLQSAKHWTEVHECLCKRRQIRGSGMCMIRWLSFLPPVMAAPWLPTGPGYPGVQTPLF